MSATATGIPALIESFSTLIKRLEAAKGPDRQLDAEISALARIATPAVPDWAYKNFPVWRARPDSRVEFVHANGTGGAHFDPPPFTESIDAALTLRPPDWSWRVGNLPSGRGFADLGTQSFLQCVEGATPAIALCVAALQARKANGRLWVQPR